MENLVPMIKEFLQNELKLTIHPDKIFIKTIFSGVDFLGWIKFSDYRILRAQTKKRMLSKIEKNISIETFDSYLGLLKHGNTDKIKRKLFKASIVF